MRLDHLLSMENVLKVERRFGIVYDDERKLWSVVQFSEVKRSLRVGVINAEGPPVPIPNTEVKLCSGENTLRETVREDSSMPTQVRERVKPFPDLNKTVKKLHCKS